MSNFSQVDVFTATPLLGNALAVVHDGSGLTDAQMQQLANWTNLSETTFLLPPTDPTADYRVRIFTPGSELPFAGHPTIGTCHAWLEAGGTPKADGVIVQECGVGLVPLRQSGGRLAFAAPALIRGGPVSEEDLEPVCAVLQVDRSEIVDAQWADNGPGWIAVMLKDADAVLEIVPDFSAAESYDIGVAGKYPVGVVGLSNTPTSQSESAIQRDVSNDSTSHSESAIGERSSRSDQVGEVGISTGSVEKVEVRAFFRAGGVAAEDPVTGSLNAALAQWLLGNGTLTAPYIARQGTAMGRAGKVFIEEADGEIWVGGDAVTVVSGSVNL